MSHAYIVGTFDTKGEELTYLKDILGHLNVPARLVDLSTQQSDSGPSRQVDISSQLVASYHPKGADAVFSLKERGEAVTAMALAFQMYVRKHKGDIAGMLGIGGSGNTALITPGMRELPIGTPKFMLSTVASGNVAPYVGPNDIAMIYSVVDIAGLNSISRKVLANAANALAGTLRFAVPETRQEERAAIALTMFGVTTPCVNYIVEKLNKSYECFVFHATGVGGQTMEKLVDSGRVTGVIDVTTTEVADLLMGGVMSAGEGRFDSIARTKVPYVGSCGALDMVNFGSLDSVPPQYKDRKLLVHNPQVTLMRTTADENRKMGEWIAHKLNACEGEVRFLLPLKGVSILDTEGQMFYDPAADAALFDALESNFIPSAKRKLIKLPYAINQEAFSEALISSFTEIQKVK
jgi:uncharacterized protein (UPF0261 family)